MKLGIFTDIHNNAAALKAVLRELEQQGCEQYVCLGDLIGIGPYPEETVSLMRRLPNLSVCIKGNHETYLTEGMPDVFPNDLGMEEAEMRHHRWEHSLLSRESREFLESLPYSKTIAVEGRNIYAVHYAMERPGRYKRYIPHPSEAELEGLLGAVNADIILYGHDHAPHMVQGSRLFINTGSLGCPGGEKNIARAGVLAIKDNVVYNPVYVKYDAGAVVRRIEQLAYPDYKNIEKYFYGA